MTPFPVTFALMSTTKGHFGVKTRWLETVDGFNKALSLDQYAARAAHIKMSPGDEILRNIMTGMLGVKGFGCYVTPGDWAHGHESHQLNYLSDLRTMFETVNTPYVLVVEDDWSPVVSDGQFVDYLARAIDWFEQNPGLMQVRIPRWTNELERINGLKAKHGLDRQAEPVDSYHFHHDDYSANPSLYRTRDIRAAVLLTQLTNLPKHVEHGVGEALRLLSGRRGNQFACFNPDKIHIRHLGTLLGEEDPLDQPLYAT